MPDEQNKACFGSAMARKGAMKWGLILQLFF